MKKQNTFWLIGIIVAVILTIYGIYSWQTSPGKYDGFSKCLSERGVRMYGTSWCSYCNQQKSLFGKSFGYIELIDCDRNKEECNSEEIQGYPTWKINGENYPGLQQLNGLAQLSGCEL